MLEDLKELEHVVGLSVNRGGSIKPPGDAVTVHTLNRGADEVLRRVGAGQKYGEISVTTAELASIIDPRHAQAVDRDVDEAIWEEMETGLRHQGGSRPT